MLMVNYTWLCQMQQVRKLSNLVVREVDLTHFVFCFSTERKKMSRNRIERKKEGNSQYSARNHFACDCAEPVGDN